MGPENFAFRGMWFIPMIFCLFMMVFMFFGRRRMGFGPNKFFDREETVIKDSSESVLDLLNKRYAKGEISKSEYQEMKTNIFK